MPEPAEHRVVDPTQETAQREGIFRTAVLVFAGFGLVGLALLAWGTTTAQRHWDAQSWPTAEATVITPAGEGELFENEGPRYRYTFEGAEHESSFFVMRDARGGQHSGTAIEHDNERRGALRAGDTVTVAVDPADPARAYVDTSLTAHDAMAGFIGMCFTLASLPFVTLITIAAKHRLARPPLGWLRLTTEGLTETAHYGAKLVVFLPVPAFAVALIVSMTMILSGTRDLTHLLYWSPLLGGMGASALLAYPMHASLERSRARVSIDAGSGTLTVARSRKEEPETVRLKDIERVEVRLRVIERMSTSNTSGNSYEHRYTPTLIVRTQEGATRDVELPFQSFASSAAIVIRWLEGHLPRPPSGAPRA